MEIFIVHRHPVTMQRMRTKVSKKRAEQIQMQKKSKTMCDIPGVGRVVHTDIIAFQKVPPPRSQSKELFITSQEYTHGKLWQVKELVTIPPNGNPTYTEIKRTPI